MRIVLSTVVFLLSTQFTFASMDCEKSLSKHFGTLNIDVKKPMKSQDYLNADLTALSKKAYQTNSPAEMQKALDAAKMYETTDSRFNEIVRVCSAIRAYAETGMNADDIELKTLSFQNGWSEPMRAPLKAAIKKEIKQLKANNEVDDICKPKTKSGNTRTSGAGVR